MPYGDCASCTYGPAVSDNCSDCYRAYSLRREERVGKLESEHWFALKLARGVADSKERERLYQQWIKLVLSIGQ